MQHLVDVSVGKAGYIGKALHKAPVILNNRCNLGLLQHDFGYPNPIGVDIGLPGKILTPVYVKPGEQTVGKPIHPSFWADQLNKFNSCLAFSFRLSGILSSRASRNFFFRFVPQQAFAFSFH